MRTTSTGEALAVAQLIIESAPTRCGAVKVITVDGPSGAGKTDFAQTLAQLLPRSQILHMDDLYPGWDGLATAVADLHDQVLAPLARGEHASYQRWDWEQNRRSRRQDIPPTDLLLVEGVGSGANPGWHFQSTLIWLEADRDERLRRGIERDGESYRPHWLRWAASEEALFETDGTRSRADLILDTSP